MSSSKRHFTVIIGNKEHGLYISSTPSSAARKAVSKLCSDNKNKKVEFFMRETTQGSNKKIYGPYLGEMKKLDKPVELEGRVIRYKPIAKLKKKSRKMKGGVEILGKGIEGIVLRPNINNLNNNGKVSKLITATQEQATQLIAFEEELNRIDEDGRYHVKMLNTREIKSENINAIPNINQTGKNEMKKYNFKITYQFGGISIENFMLNLKERKNGYVDLINPRFIKGLLRGIVNCFQGLYIFYEGGMVHSDLHEGNIVFLLDSPEIMRLIDWGILMQSDTYKEWGLNKSILYSLYSFYSVINIFLSKLKLSKDNISNLLEEFLNIPNFEIYSTQYKPSIGRILNKSEIDGVRSQMETLIDQLSEV
jgi:hypothetical protein